ncbi:MAG: hypothetical protein GY769_10555 [bacterium]|nr:hypothetical protein [bacterium]
MKRAFVDTSVLTDILLKPFAASAARQALATYETSSLPVYAIKEFKAGPLKHYVWMHDRLANLGSFRDAVLALQRESGTPRKYLTSTALEALAEGANEMISADLAGLVDKYGPTASPDKVLCDSYRLALKLRIFTAWEKRRSVTSTVGPELVCYPEKPLKEKPNKLIEIQPVLCRPKDECCMGQELRARKPDLKRLLEALKSLPCGFR